MLLNRGPFPLPLTIDDIDRSWLTAALRTTVPDATVNDFKIADVNNGTCTKIRVHLDLDDNARKAGITGSVIVKGGFEAHSRSLDHMHKMEALGYRDIYSTLELPTPKCWFADYDEEGHQGIVIMEDLVERGVTFCNPLSAATFEEVDRRLAVLAGFHAKTWNSEHWQPEGKWNWVGNGADTMLRHFKQFFVPEVWRHYIESPRGAAVSVRYHDAGWMEDACVRLQRLASRRDHCIIHGDTHPGNLYVDVDGTPGFFDSLPNHTPPMSEITYHMTCALDPIDRRHWERDLIGRYLDKLREHGVNAPPIEQAMADYAAWLAKAYLIFVVNDTVFQKESVNTVYCGRINVAMLDHNTLGVLEQIV